MGNATNVTVMRASKCRRFAAFISAMILTYKVGMNGVESRVSIEKGKVHFVAVTLKVVQDQSTFYHGQINCGACQLSGNLVIPNVVLRLRINASSFAEYTSMSGVTTGSLLALLCSDPLEVRLAWALLTRCSETKS